MTTRQPIATEIAAEAADWIVRRDGGPLTVEDARAFDLWRAQPGHGEALARLEKVWGLLDDDQELAWNTVEEKVSGQPASLPRLRAADGARQRRALNMTIGAPRRFLAIGSIAAALAFAVLGGVQDWSNWLRADYATGIGERRVVTLADGSVIRLDSGSAIALDYSGARRGIRLLAGAAMFEVAPDRARPFTVTADGGSVTALGTAFAIRDEGETATVTVTRHSVRVEGNGKAAVVAEGQRADFGRATLIGPMTAQGDATAWTRGRLVVADRPLGEVVEQIGRYRRGYVAVTGSAAAIRVSGVYDLDHPLAAIESIQASHGLSSVRLSNRFIILRR